MSHEPESHKPVPSPRLSVLSQNLKFRSDPMSLLSELRRECGDIFELRLFGLGRVVGIASPELLHELYQKPEEDVVAGEIRGRILGHMVGSQASVNLDGDEYTRRRKVTTPFFGGRRVFAHTDHIRRVTEEIISRWPASQPFAIQEDLDEISRRVACRILFGPDDRPEIKRLVELSGLFLRSLQSPWVQIPALHWTAVGKWTPWGRFQAAKQALFDGVEREARARIAGKVPDSEDLISALLAEYGADDEAIEIVTHEIASFVIGGAETTSKVLAWILSDVLSHPTAVARVRAEIDEVLNDRPIGSEHLRQLPYLHAVVQEGLRTARTGPFAGLRWTRREITLGEYRIPAERVLGHCLTETGRNDRFPQRETFEPANFLDRKVHMSEWVPFGGGSRMCTGMGLAQLELAVVLATVLRKVRLELCDPAPLRPVLSGIAFVPAGGLRVRIKSEPAAQAA